MSLINKKSTLKAVTCLLGVSFSCMAIAQETTNEMVVPVTETAPVPAQTPVPAPEVQKIPTPKSLKITQNGQTFIVPISNETQEIILPSTQVPEKVAVKEPVQTPAPAPVTSEVSAANMLAQIGNGIANSKFYIELKPLSYSYEDASIKSNDLFNDRRLFEIKGNSSRLRVLPTDFRFGFENNNWWSVADIVIEDDTQSGDIAVFSKVGPLKVGLGLNLDYQRTELKAYKMESEVSSSIEKSTYIGPYLYLATTTENSQSEFNLWGKAGWFFSTAEVDGSDIDINGLGVSGGMDYYQKINSKLYIGLGGEFTYMYAKSDKEYNFDMNQILFELSVFKVKYHF